MIIMIMIIIPIPPPQVVATKSNGALQKTSLGCAGPPVVTSRSATSGIT